MPTSGGWYATTDFLRRDSLRVFWKSSRVACAYVLRLNSVLPPPPSTHLPPWPNIETRTRTIPVTVVPPDWKISLKISPRKSRLELPFLQFCASFPRTLESIRFENSLLTERIKLYIDYSLLPTIFRGINQVSRKNEKIGNSERNWGTWISDPFSKGPSSKNSSSHVLSGIPDSTW